MESNVKTPRGAILGKGPAAQTLKRIRAFLNQFSEVRTRRERFARALGLDWTTKAGRDIPDDPENFERHAVNLSFVYSRYLKARASGAPPVIEYDKGAGAGQTESGEQGDVPGDEVLADPIVTLLKRIVRESGAVEAWTEGIDDILAWGPACAAIGYSHNVVHPEIAENILKPVRVIQQEALGGDVVAKKGERHQEAAEHLRDLTARSLDAEDIEVDLSPEEMARLHARAQSHDEAARKEAKKPLPPAWDGHRIWARRLQVGVDVFWDSSVTNPEDTTWRARRIEMTLGEFKASDLFSQSAKSAMKGLYLRGATGMGEDHEKSEDHHGNRDIDAEEKVVILYEVWVKKPNMISGGERHYVSPALPDQFLERSSANPWVEASTGRPLIPGFWPIFIAVPIMAPINEPVRTLGIPALAPGWPQQIEANELRGLSLEAARKHSKRIYIYDHRFPKSSQIEKALKGPDAAFIKSPPNVKDAADRKNLITSPQMGANNMELDRQAAQVYSDWRQIQGVPSSVLAGMGASETLGQDEMAAQQGQTLADLIIDTIERTFERMVEGMRGLSKRLPPEHVRRMVGEKITSAFEIWKQTSTDGDRIRARFGPSANAQERVDRKQLMELISLYMTIVEGGAQVYDIHPYIAKLSRSMGEGEPIKLDPEQRQLIQAANTLAQIMEKIGPEGVQQLLAGGMGNGRPGPDKSPVRASGNDPRSPSNANIGVGARRGANTVNN